MVFILSMSKMLSLASLILIAFANADSENNNGTGCSLEQGCGCHSKYLITRPDCSASEEVFWCSGDLEVNDQGYHGSVLFGSEEFCDRFPKYGYLMFQDYDGCSDEHGEKKEHAYLADANGKQYSSSHSIIVSQYTDYGVFEVSSNDNEALTFIIFKDNGKFSFKEGNSIYDFVSTSTVCSVSFWYAFPSKNSEGNLVMKTNLTEYVDGCACNEENNKTYTPTSTNETMVPSASTSGLREKQVTYPTKYPTRYPTRYPTYPTRRPTYPTRRPTYPTRRPTYPTPHPTYETVCPSSSPLKCRGYSYDYCCPYGLGGSTQVCCDSQNSCACRETGKCPYKNQCCSASYPLMCSGANGKEYCCKYGPNGSTNVCCSATNSCEFEGACCPASAPLFCGSPGNRYCCPYGNGGSTNVCCNGSRTCTQNGFCSSGKTLLARIDNVLGPAVPQEETEKVHKGPSLRVGEKDSFSKDVGLSAITETKGDGRGDNAPEHDVGDNEA